jgi:hypothetical protein
VPVCPYEATGSYFVVRIIAAALGAIVAILCLPIDECNVAILNTMNSHA